MSKNLPHDNYSFIQNKYLFKLTLWLWNKFTRHKLLEYEKEKANDDTQ